MSFAVDANLLVYASVASSPFHEAARAFLDRCRADTEIFCLAWPTVMGYLRLVTNPVVMTRPLSADDAMNNIDALLALPQVRLLSEGENFWSAYRDATRGLSVRGNLVPDAHLAAILRHHGVKTLYTNDGDFRRFKFLDVKNPFARR